MYLNKFIKESKKNIKKMKLTGREDPAAVRELFEKQAAA